MPSFTGGICSPRMAPPVEAKIIFLTPAARHASSTFRVPIALISKFRRGFSTDSMTRVCAARCTTTSTPWHALATAAVSRMSPTCNSTLNRSMSWRLPRLRLSRTRTRSPRAVSCVSRLTPINPQPPVTRYCFIRDSRCPLCFRLGLNSGGVSRLHGGALRSAGCDCDQPAILQAVIHTPPTNSPARETDQPNSKGQGVPKRDQRKALPDSGLLHGSHSDQTGNDDSHHEVSAQ